MPEFPDALIEQAARAACGAHNGDGCRDWDDEEPLWRDTYRDMSRAVLAAIAPAIEAQALRKCAKEAHERGDIGRPGQIEVWDWLNIRADQLNPKEER